MTVPLNDKERMDLFSAWPRPADIILDTDTFNEIDDQFAVVYAILSKDSMRVRAICAAPFLNSRSTSPGDGMEKSHQEILRLLERLKNAGDTKVVRGSRTFMAGPDRPVDSEAVEVIRGEVMKHSPQNPLYVLAIGAPTNVSSALLAHPDIAGKVVVVWLGGHARWWPDTAEFNCRQDPHATRVLFDSGVALVQIPCMGVASHLVTTLPEIEANVKDRGPIGAYLWQIYHDYQEQRPGISKVLWDLATVGYMRDQAWAHCTYEHSPTLNENMTYSVDPRRHLIRCAYSLDRDAILGDFYSLL